MNGRFGWNCESSCLTGYYGFLCQTPCECLHHLCDKETGCHSQQNETSATNYTPSTINFKEAVSQGENTVGLIKHILPVENLNDDFNHSNFNSTSDVEIDLRGYSLTDIKEGHSH